MSVDKILDTEMYLRYLGVLGLLGECSPYVNDEIRETIEMAMEDAASHHPIRVVRTMDRIEIEPIFTSGRDAYDRTGE